MKGTRILLGTLAAVLVFAASGFSQVRFSTPLSDGYFPPYITANVDDGGVQDFRCGDRTYPGHCGTDMGVGLGTPLYAAASGYVDLINTGCPYGYYCSPCGGGFGNYVRMYGSLDSSWQFVVAHLSQVDLNPGSYSDCNNGPRVGLSGSSGCSTGPHVHFQVYHYGSWGAPWCAGDDPYAGDCAGPESFWVCQNYNEDICSNACQSVGISRREEQPVSIYGERSEAAPACRDAERTQ